MPSPWDVFPLAESQTALAEPAPQPEQFGAQQQPITQSSSNPWDAFPLANTLEGPNNQAEQDIADANERDRVRNIDFNLRSLRRQKAATAVADEQDAAMNDFTGAMSNRIMRNAIEIGMLFKGAKFSDIDDIIARDKFREIQGRIESELPDHITGERREKILTEMQIGARKQNDYFQLAARMSGSERDAVRQEEGVRKLWKRWTPKERGDFLQAMNLTMKEVDLNRRRSGISRIGEKFLRGGRDISSYAGNARDFLTGGGNSDFDQYFNAVLAAREQGDLAKGDNFFTEGFLSAVEMSPTLAAAVATGGVGGAAAIGLGATSAGAATAAAGAGTAFWYLDAAPDLRQDFLESGASLSNATTGAAIASLPFAMLESMQLSKLMPKGVDKQIKKNIVQNTLRSLTRLKNQGVIEAGEFTVRRSGDLVRQGVEEGLQQVTQSTAKAVLAEIDANVTFDHEEEWAKVRENFKQGIAASIFLMGPATLSDSVSEFNAGLDRKGQYTATQELKEKRNAASETARQTDPNRLSPFEQGNIAEDEAAARITAAAGAEVDPISGEFEAEPTGQKGERARARLQERQLGEAETEFVSARGEELRERGIVVTPEVAEELQQVGPSSKAKMAEALGVDEAVIPPRAERQKFIDDIIERSQAEPEAESEAVAEEDRDPAARQEGEGPLEFLDRSFKEAGAEGFDGRQPGETLEQFKSGMQETLAQETIETEERAAIEELIQQEEVQERIGIAQGRIPKPKKKGLLKPKTKPVEKAVSPEPRKLEPEQEAKLFEGAPDLQTETDDGIRQIITTLSGDSTQKRAKALASMARSELLVEINDILNPPRPKSIVEKIKPERPTKRIGTKKQSQAERSAAAAKSPEVFAAISDTHAKVGKQITKLQSEGGLTQADGAILRAVFSNSDAKFLEKTTLRFQESMTTEEAETWLSRNPASAVAVDPETLRKMALAQTRPSDEGFDVVVFGKAVEFDEQLRSTLHEIGHVAFFQLSEDQQREALSTYQILSNEENGIQNYFTNVLGVELDQAKTEHFKDPSEFFAEHFALSMLSRRVPSTRLGQIIQDLAKKVRELLRSLFAKNDITSETRNRMEKIIDIAGGFGEKKGLLKKAGDAALAVGESEAEPIRRTKKKRLRALPTSDEIIRAGMRKVEESFEPDVKKWEVADKAADELLKHHHDETKAKIRTLIINKFSTANMVESKALDKLAVEAQRAAQDNPSQANKREATLWTAGMFNSRGETSRILGRRDANKTKEEVREGILNEAIFKPKPQNPENKPPANTEDDINDPIRMDYDHKANENGEYDQGLKDLTDRLEELGYDPWNLTEIAQDPFASHELLGYIRESDPNPLDVINEYWQQAILSAFQTDIVNVGGTIFNGITVYGWQRPIEAVINKVFRIEGGAELGEIYQYITKGVMPGVLRGVKMFAKSWRYELAGLEVSLGAKEVTGLAGRGKAIKGKKGRFIRKFGWTKMQAADAFTKSIIYEMELVAQSYRTAKGEQRKKKKRIGKREKRDPNAKPVSIFDRMNELQANDHLMSEESQIALKVAQDLAFQGTGNVLTEGLKRGLKSVRKEIFGAPRFVIPFVDTPVNLFAQGLRKSPLGIMNLAYEYAAARRSGDYRKSLTLAAELLAWMPVWLLVFGNDPDDPWITGATGFDTPAQRAESFRTGRTKMSIKLPWSSKWKSYARWEPMAIVVATTVDLSNSFRNNGLLSVPAEVIDTLISQSKSKPFLQGITDVARMAEDPSHRSTGRWASNFAASFVPNIIKSPVRESVDAVPERRVWGEGEEFRSSLIKRTLQKTELHIIKDHKKFDLWGNVAQRGLPPAMTDWPWRILDPSDTKLETIFIGDAVIMKWNREHPGDEKPLSEIDPVFTNPETSKRTFMSDEQFEKFVEFAGKSAKFVVGKLPLDPDRATEDDVAWIKDSISTTRAEARKNFAAEWSGGDEYKETSEELGQRMWDKQVKRMKDLKAWKWRPAPGKDFDKRMSAFRKKRNKAVAFLKATGE